MSNHLDYNAPIIPGGSFTWGEYAILQQWNAFAIPSEKQKQETIRLFTALEPPRKELGKLLRINSGARTPEYTLYLRSKGTPAAIRSAHVDWQAVDLSCPGISNLALWNFFDKRWPGRMENISATPSWVHLDTRNWGQKLRFNP